MKLNNFDGEQSRHRPENSTPVGIGHEKKKEAAQKSFK